MGTPINKLIIASNQNNVLTDTDNPEAIDNGVGTVYYTDSVNDGDITTTQVSGSRPIYLQIATAIATEVIATDTNLPDSGDVVKINDIEVFNGATDSVADLTEWISLINTFTNDNNVIASNQVRYINTNCRTCKQIESRFEWSQSDTWFNSYIT